MQDEIVILVNPLAKKQKVDKILNSVINVLQERKIKYASFIEWPSDIQPYKEAWVIGGDGTLNYFLNYYKTISVPIVIFKGGTGNDFATRLYGTMDAKEQAQFALTASEKKVDAATCNERIFINGVGVGFDGEVLRSMKSIRLLGGHLGYYSVVIRKIFSFTEKRYRIVFRGKEIINRFLLVMITNSSTTGGGFKVSPEAKIDDGLLNMILCRPLNVFNRLKNLPVIEKGKHLHKNFIIHHQTGDVKIECDQETLAQIDGELISEKTFDIKVLPGRYIFKY